MKDTENRLFRSKNTGLYSDALSRNISFKPASNPTNPKYKAIFQCNIPVIKP